MSPILQICFIFQKLFGVDQNPLWNTRFIIQLSRRSPLTNVSVAAVMELPSDKSRTKTKLSQ